MDVLYGAQVFGAKRISTFVLCSQSYYNFLRVPCVAILSNNESLIVFEKIQKQQYCSLSLWRVARGSKRMFLELIHGLFIT
jgi:hypothetical protein